MNDDVNKVPFNNSNYAISFINFFLDLGQSGTYV